MNCPQCNQELNFPEEVLKKFTNCPFCGAVLVLEKKKESSLLQNECINPTDEKISSLEKDLRQIIDEYGGLEIFSEENVSRLNKAFDRIESSQDRYHLQMLNKLGVLQRLYACSSLPHTEKAKVLKTCQRDLLESSISKEYCYDVLSILSLMMFNVKLADIDKEFDRCENKNDSNKMPSAKAFIARIEGFEQIRNEASFEIAYVSGINVVVKKGQYSLGERVVYIRPNTRVRSDFACFDYLKETDYYVKEREFRGIWSKGVIAKPSDLRIGNLSLYNDVSNIVQDYGDKGSSIQNRPIDNQDIRHWKEDKFFKNVYSSEQFKNADLESKAEMRRAAKEEAKMIKALRRDAGLGGGCYITTAICEASGKPDDCYELTMMRKFRDQWLAKQPDGYYLINDYYETAPKIVAAIDSLRERSSIYDYLNCNFLKKCVDFAGRNLMADCKKCYMDMVQYCHKFLNE